jgi:hypothetical protein
LKVLVKVWDFEKFWKSFGKSFGFLKSFEKFGKKFWKSFGKSFGFLKSLGKSLGKVWDF